MSNTGKWKCTNPECPTIKQGVFYFSDSPSYERKACKTCGAPMHRFAGSDAVIVIPSGQATGLLSSGRLPIKHPKQGVLQRMLGVHGKPSIDDPDVLSYPDLKSAQNDPRILNPNLYEYLQTADLFLVRIQDRPATVVVFRCPSHNLSKPVATIQEVGIHAEAFPIMEHTIFAIYPLLFDHPTNPFFSEAAALPYDLVTASQQDLSKPIIHGYEWRKLFYLFRQSHTEFIILDEHHRVAGTRTCQLRTGQRPQFDNLLSELQICSGASIDRQTHANIHTALGRETNIEAIQARFPKLG